MLSVLQTCEPRPEILRGTFNPEVYTASLSPVLEFYRTGRQGIDEVYTDAETFFKEATFPTQGLRTTLTEVFARIAGDVSVPAIHRLETAFGGGKTHTLIACTHIAYKGKQLAHVTRDLLDGSLLPEPGSVSVVGIAGDQIPVHRPHGEDLAPYTLWGEIAYQVGGKALYNEVLEEATSYAAPGETFFRKVFGGRKVLVMLDELAQYAARLEAARPDGASQLAAFLMTLHGYARTNSGVAVILTLASAADAFARQTERLAQLISEVRGEETGESDALGIGEQAVRSVTSVVARDAVQVTPVLANEISAVLAKRLFKSIDFDAAKQTAERYAEMYERNAELLPDTATDSNAKDRMIATYPFHPTLIDFLNYKLAEAENFQGTRGVLRVLALVVRSLWQKQLSVPMIHACHIDLRSERVVNEILGRTGSPDLLVALTADVGSVDTGRLEARASNAELADRRNPHPEGHSLYEYTWKTVFLHSLVGRAEGVSSNLFGLTEAEALYAVSFPGMTPAQVLTALEEIPRTAFYLRFAEGKYFASDVPTINSVLARIRNQLRRQETYELINQTAAKIVQGVSGSIHVENLVRQPEDIPDGKGKPVLAVVAIDAETIDVEAMITTAGVNRPRIQQNTVILLAPVTVSVKKEREQTTLAAIDGSANRYEEARRRIEHIAKEVRALRKLTSDPHKYGINPKQLQEDEFKRMRAEREQGLQTAVAGAYTRLFFPSASGGVVEREIRTAGGESGRPFFETIRELLVRDGELLTAAHTSRSDVMNLAQIFFRTSSVVAIKELQERFLSYRSWPMLENPSVLEPIIRAGVSHGAWYIYRMGAESDSTPVELYDENGIPMGVDLMAGGYSLVTPQGAKQRGWLEEPGVSVSDVAADVLELLEQSGPWTVREIKQTIEKKYDELPSTHVHDAVSDLVRRGQVMFYQGSKDQEEAPELFSGVRAVFRPPGPDDVLITREQAEGRHWLETASGRPQISLGGAEGAKVLRGIIPRLGSLYNRGATTTIDHLTIGEIALPAGGRLSINLHDVTPEAMRSLGELFEVLGAVLQQSDLRESFLTVRDMDENCLFIAEVMAAQNEEPISHDD